MWIRVIINMFYIIMIFNTIASRKIKKSSRNEKIMNLCNYFFSNFLHSCHITAAINNPIITCAVRMLWGSVCQEMIPYNARRATKAVKLTRSLHTMRRFKHPARIIAISAAVCSYHPNRSSWYCRYIISITRLAIFTHPI